MRDEVRDEEAFSPDWERALEFILGNVSRSNLIEMYYWVQEPDLLRIVRALAAAPVETRKALDAILDEARHAQQEVRAGSDGEDLMLRRDVTATLTVMRH